jgi:methionyl aminopeptidase
MANINEEERRKDFHKAADIHREVRKYANTIIKPGIKMVDLCQSVESKIIELGGELAFPTGCSLNNVAAHYTPNYEDNTILNADDIMKLDFGVHINGSIIDSAYTWYQNEKHKELTDIVKEATYEAIKMAGVDQRLDEIGSKVEEIFMSSSNIHVIDNLFGHNILPYKIHGEKRVSPTSYSLEMIDYSESLMRMEDGEIYAIEIFGTTEEDYSDVFNSGICSTYMIKNDLSEDNKLSSQAKLLYNVIKKEFNTLPWCRRWLEDRIKLTPNKYLLPLKQLHDEDIITAYPPLAGGKDCYIAQFEHTIALWSTGKEVLSMGDDY